MDLTTRIARWKDQSAERWIQTANRFLPPGVTALLVIAIAYQLAVLTWRVVPGGTASVTLPAIAPPTTGGRASERSSDFSELPGAHLFGEAPADATAVVPSEVEEAPDTTLSLQLTAILYGEGGLPSQAIIASSSNVQKKYGIGQAIDGANGATVHSVHSDRVLLNRGDRLEQLRLPRQYASGPVGRVPTRPVAPPMPAESGSLRQVISENATRLTDIMRITPHVEQGQVVGFRINPGRDREMFETLGLQPGDVVTDINGTVLDDPARGLQVFEALGEATMANVTVLRNGVPQLIVIDTSQLQSLEENRE